MKYVHWILAGTCVLMMTALVLDPSAAFGRGGGGRRRRRWRSAVGVAVAEE